MNAEHQSAVAHLKERMSDHPRAVMVAVEIEHLKQLDSLIAELEADKRRLEFIFHIIFINGTDGLQNFPWSCVLDEGGERTEDIVFDRPAIDAAMKGAV